VNSSIKSIYIGIDLLWSAHLNRYVDFEAGLGVGVAYLFGNLVNNWVYPDSNGPLVTPYGVHYSGCVNPSDAPSCDPANHQNSSVTKTGRYVEPTWFSGGSVPSLYMRINAPILGLRFKPMRDLVIRTDVALSLTEGFMFGASLDFRLPTGS
jgi:hypothetical protein